MARNDNTDTEIVTVARGEIPDPIVVQVTNAETGEPIDLDDVDHVRFRLVSDDGVAWDKRGRVVDPDAGHIAYEWSRTDLQIPARHYDAAFKIRFGDRRSLIAPTDGRLVVHVADSPFSE